MPGPPPTPFRLRLLRGNPGKQRMRPEPQPLCPAQCPERPSFLTGYAADEWDRIAPELHRLGLLTVLDIAVLTVYCGTYARWRTVEEMLAGPDEPKSGPHGPRTKAEKRMAPDDVQRIPLMRISRDAARDMVKIAGLYGMTPVARTRLAGGIGGQPRKFDGLIT